jgi:hypothetical protein
MADDKGFKERTQSRMRERGVPKFASPESHARNKKNDALSRRAMASKSAQPSKSYVEANQWTDPIFRQGKLRYERDVQMKEEERDAAGSMHELEGIELLRLDENIPDSGEEVQSRLTTMFSEMSGREEFMTKVMMAGSFPDLWEAYKETVAFRLTEEQGK